MQGACVEAHSPLLIERDFYAHLRQQRQRGSYIAQVRHVLYLQGVARQDCRAKDGQRRVLRSRYAYLAREAHAPLDDELVHHSSARQSSVVKVRMDRAWISSRIRSPKARYTSWCCCTRDLPRNASLTMTA